MSKRRFRLGMGRHAIDQYKRLSRAARKRREGILRDQISALTYDLEEAHALLKATRRQHAAEIQAIRDAVDSVQGMADDLQSDCDVQIVRADQLQRDRSDPLDTRHARAEARVLADLADVARTAAQRVREALPQIDTDTDTDTEEGS